MRTSLFLFYLLISLILAVRLFFFYSNQPQFNDGQIINFTTTISSTPKIYQNYQSLYVNLSPLTGVLVKLSLDREFNYGDKIQVSGKLKSRLLNSGDTIFTMDHPKVELKNHEINPFLAVIYSIRQNIINFFQQKLDIASAGLLLGIVFGIKDSLPKEFLTQIQQTGVMHVIAASGMNVTMVSGFLFYFFILFFKRQIAIVLAILGIVFYVALAGFEASIIRAGIMGVIVFSAQIIGKQKFSSHTLFLTVALMLFAWPEFLTSIGFQLSVAATMGIIYIPSLFKRFINKFNEVFIITIAAQIATLPILISNFGNYSLFSIITNALVLWTIPILTILGMISAVFVFIFPLFALVLLYLALPFLLFFQKTVEFFASVGAVLIIPEISWQFVISYYLILISIMVFLYEKVSNSRNS
ncbi:MAG: hypothetical protein A3B38_02315 [Candidatus Levybacteria bacterium RIFCSPLOWO2_01_FULL_36_13]|nr:MAG: hypothetical protein A2684_03510 [Candidatus Levybacteria bacterium RIFCSPHIGHO2_01_FULL_36_15b]OGH35121.1 MAG: hypothetical protein A3B38_02315 [Candidatus Levybacteria bacterium RIFCSPLOWO2_01_FULL_36_13]